MESDTDKCIQYDNVDINCTLNMYSGESNEMCAKSTGYD